MDMDTPHGQGLSDLYIGLSSAPIYAPFTVFSGL